MHTRKNLYDLTEDERLRLIDAFLRLKAKGIYDEFVREHQSAMTIPTPLGGEIANTGTRNAAHRGPGFLPWHREYLRRFELALQAEIPGVTLPYWDWASDADLEDPKTARIWTADFLGGGGRAENGYEVVDGPFVREFWPVAEDLGDPALRRRFGIFEVLDGDVVRKQELQLSGQAEVDELMLEIEYDTAPWGRFVPGFRNRLEGWQRAAAGQITGSRMHNVVHLWVGGAWIGEEDGRPVGRVGSMLPGTSPNDPAFFLNHCFVDKLWANWQTKQQAERPEKAPHYLPVGEGPSGHALDDTMYPWGDGATPNSVLDISTLGYDYAETHLPSEGGGTGSGTVAANPAAAATAAPLRTQLQVGKNAYAE